MAYSNHAARLLALAATIAAVAALSACSALVSPAKLDRATGTLSFAAAIDLQSMGGVVSAKIVATHEGMRREAVFPVVDNVISGSIDNLPIGDWDVRIELIDASGDTTHVAEATVRVRPNETVVAELQAQPVESELEIIADLTGFPGAEEIKNVRVSLGGNRTMTLHQAEDDALTFSGVRELPPGDYDFNISLFKESTYVADRVYISPWTHVRLVPGKTTRVIWQAQTGNTVIDASLVDMPQPPRGVALDVRDDEVWLTWTAAPEGPPASLYRIYRKEDVFAAYKQIAEVPAEVDEHLIGPVPAESTEAVLAVTAVSAEGLESFRSDPVPLSDALK